jgi:tetratricopeptide (TPR) repeat protein
LNFSFPQIFARIACLLTLVSPASLFAQSALRPARVPTAADLIVILRGSDSVSKEQLNSLKSEARASAGASLQSGVKILQYGTALRQVEEARWLSLLAQYEAQTNPANAQRPELVTAASLREFTSAKQIFEKLYRGKSKWKPSGLLSYGYALAVTADPLSVNVLDRLTTKFPKSRITQEGYLALAHYYFDAGDFERTNRELKRVEGKSGSLVIYRKYLEAWMSFLTMRQSGKKLPAQKMISPFTELLAGIGESEQSAIKRIKSRVQGDVVSLIADIGDITVAKSLLLKLEQQAAYRTVAERIAQRKIASNELEAAYNVYRSLVKEFPNDKRNPQLMNSAIEIAASQNNVQRIVTDLNFMVNQYVEESSAWFTANEEEELVKAEVLVKSAVYRYATEMDRLFRQNKDKRLKSGAVILYNLFATKFPRDRRAAEIKLNLAQMYYQEKNYERTAQLATELLKKYKKSPQSKDGADLLLASAQSMFDVERPRLKLPAPGRAKNPIPLTKASSQYADSLDLYLETFPKSPNADAIIFAAASVYFDFGDYDEAGVRIDRLVSEHPNSDFGIKGAYLMLGYYLLVKDEELLTEFQQLCAKSAKLASHPEIAPLLKRKISGSSAAPAVAKASPSPTASPEAEAAEDESEESAE